MERVAVVAARRNLLEAIQGVQVDSTTQVEGFMLRSDRVRTIVRGLLEGARVVEIRTDPDGSLEAVVEIPLAGRLTGTLLEEMDREKGVGEGTPGEGGGLLAPVDRAFAWLGVGLRRLVRAFGEGWDDFTGAGEAFAAIPRESTGLVVDASELRLRPALFPRLFDVQGRLVYGPGVFDPATAARRGSVGYAPSVEAAFKETSRLGIKPAVSRGVIPLGRQSGVDIGLLDYDLNRLQVALKSPEVLKDCGVSVVYKVTF